MTRQVSKNKEKTEFKLVLSPTKTARFLGLIVLLLIIASLSGQMIQYLTRFDYVYGLIPLFYADEERSVPTVFSVFLLFFSAFLMFIIAIFSKHYKVSSALSWFVLSLGFLFMAFDEGAAIHELLIRPVRTKVGEGILPIFFFAWIIPGVLVVMLVGLLFIKFIINLPRKTRKLIILSAVIYLSGVIGGELIGGYWASIHDIKNLTYSIISTIEEGFEMSGLVLLIYCLLDYIEHHIKNIHLRVEN